jgi:hypothetical protein
MRHLLQRLWPSEPRGGHRGPTASAQVPARLWRSLHQEMVARVGQLPLLPRQAPFRVGSHLRSSCISESHPHAPPDAAKRGTGVREPPPPPRGYEPFLLTVLSDESFMRMMGQQEQREAARARARQEAASDNTPPRPFHHRERRSPPSEAEGRRRTRARHSSFHPGHPAGGFASAPASRASTGAPPAGQQSPSRERVMTPSNLPWPYCSPYRSLTPHLARQSLPGAHGLFYTPPGDMTHLSSAAPQLQQPMSPSNPGSAGFRGANPPGHVLPTTTPAYYPSLSFGTAPGAPFSQQLPSLGSFGGPPFPTSANGGSSSAGMNPGGAQSQMQ